MAPALIEATATVSQKSGRKFNIIKTELFENLTRDFAKETRVTATTGRTSESTKPSLGDPTTQLHDTALHNKAVNREKVVNSDQKHSNLLSCIMNQKETSSEAPKLSPGDESFVQSSETKLQSSVTCAPIEAEGAKNEGVRSQPLAESTPYMTLRARTNNCNTKLLKLNDRAKNLKQRMRSFQTKRLLAHVKTQAQLLDYSHKASSDPETKSDLKISESLEVGQNQGQKNLQKYKTSANSLKIPAFTPSPTLNLSSTMSEPKIDSCRKAQAPALGPALTMLDKDTNVTNVTAGKKKVFNILTNSVKDMMNLEDPDATDPESDADDNTEVSPQKRERSSLQMLKKGNLYDQRWAKDRVKVGSMCTWIQAQIADLSHKIKRYGDLHQHVKGNRKQLVLEETKPQTAACTDTHKPIQDPVLGKDDFNGDSLQGNIFSRLQAHKNGLAKDLSAQPETESKYEKGSGARTIPAAKLPKHKYLRRSIETAFKGNSIAYQCTNLPSPFPCAQCLKATATGHGRTTGNLAAVYLDHSYHEQLSTKYDLPLPYVLESTLRKEKMNTDKRVLLTAATVKGALAEKKKAAERLQQDSSSASKASRLRLDKKRQRRASRLTEEDSEKEDSPAPKKKALLQTAASLLQRRASSLRAPSSGSGESRPSTPVTDQHALSASCPAPSFAQLVKKKTRTSSEYDINNIVIPYSISSSTRLEKPQYKEILTPGWRSIDGELEERLGSIIEQQEDTRDHAYAYRHSRYEALEHHKFTAYFQMPNKKSRSTRKSSECNTPEPYSPSQPDTPGSAHTPTEFVLATPHSGKLSKQISWTLQLNTEDSKVFPWPARNFPLPTDDLDSESNDADFDDERRVRTQQQSQESVPMELDEIEENNEIDVSEQRASENASPTFSVESVDSSDTAASSESDLLTELPEVSPTDEGDENWTVKLVTDDKSSTADSGPVRKGIVLKLAKK